MGHRILYLASLNPGKLGSMEEHALFLARELKRRGDACLLGFIAEPAPEVRALFEECGARIITVHHDEGGLMADPLRKLREAAALRRLVREERIDLVHVNFIRLTNPLLWGLHLTGAKLVFTDHASGLVLRRSLVKKSLSRLLHGFLSRRVARYIGVSDYVRDRLRETHHVAPPRVVTLYNGVNVERFVPGDAYPAREALGLPGAAAILGCVAMLIPDKGVQDLIEAVALLAGRRPDTNPLLLVVGKGYHRVALEKLAEERGIGDRVRFLGRRSDVHVILAASDVVVAPPLWEEAFGLIIAEAMAAGRPVVATRSGAIPELIRDGDTGLLVAKGDPDGLYRAVERLLSDDELRRSIVAAALDRVSRDFNLATQVKRLVDLYGEILNGRIAGGGVR